MQIGISFAGQGDQKSGMFREVYQQYVSARRIFEEASDVLHIDIAYYCFEADSQELNLTQIAQPCLMTGEYALYRIFEEICGKPYCIAGFSLGECVAAVAADCIGFDEGLKLVAVRAQAMQQCVPLGMGAMAAFLGRSAETVEQMCRAAGGHVWPSNYNAPEQIVISGELDAVNAVCQAASDAGIAVIKLDVSAPSHCPLMQPAADALERHLLSVTFMKATVPVVTGIDAVMTVDGGELKKKLIRQLVTPICYARCLHTMQVAGVEAFIEIGPGRTLTGLVKKTLPEARRLYIFDIKTLEDTLHVVNA